MNRKQVIIKNYTVLLGSQILSKLINFVATLYLLAHFLGVTNFGAYNSVLAFIAIFNFLSDLGIAQITTREISKDRDNAEKYYNAFFTLQIVISIVTFLIILLSTLVLKSSYSQTELTGIIIAGLGICLGSLARPFSALIYAEEKMEYVALAIFIPSIINLILVVIYTKFILGSMTTFFFIYLLNNIFTTIIFFYGAKTINVNFKIKFDFKTWKVLLIMSLPMLVVMAFNILYNKIDVILLHFIKGDYYVGLYSLADKFVDALIIVPATVGTALFPALVKSKNISDEVFTDLFEKAIKYTQIVTAGVCLLIGLNADKLISLIKLTNGYKSVPALEILLWVIFINGLYVIYTNMLIALTKMRILAIANITALLFNFIVNLIVIPKFNFMGAAYVSVATELVIFTIYFFYTKHLLNMKFNFSIILRLIIIALILILINNLLYRLNMYLLFFIEGMLYCLFVYVFQLIKKDELLSLNMFRQD